MHAHIEKLKCSYIARPKGNWHTRNTMHVIYMVEHDSEIKIVNDKFYNDMIIL